MRHNVLSFCAFLTMAFTAGSGLSAGMAGDAEAASHGDEAAFPQLVAETEIKADDFVFRQYNLGVLSHYSYLIGSGGEAMIVDPARDIGKYLEDAKALNLKITRVYMTHSHADFVAGHAELAKACGAKIIANEATQAGYPHKPVKDGDTIAFGNVRGVVVTTPGHTPDGTCLYVHHPASAPDPDFVLTGDTLFIGSVGRPDLMGEGMTAAALARMGFDSWNQKLSKLPDATKIFPAHGAGSLCGAHLSDKPVSTIGEQRLENPYIHHKDLNAYVMAVIDGLPAAFLQRVAVRIEDRRAHLLVDRHDLLQPLLAGEAHQRQAEAGDLAVEAHEFEMADHLVAEAGMDRLDEIDLVGERIEHLEIGDGRIDPERPQRRVVPGEFVDRRQAFLVI